MQLSLFRMLQTQRGIYDLPRDANRFRKYIETMTGGGSDMVLPMVAMNPMSKDTGPKRFDQLLALDAEGIAEGAVKESEQRLRAIPGKFQVALTVADDLQGGWTDRANTEAHERSDLHAAYNRGWIVVTFWTSEEASEDVVRRETAASIYRSIHQVRKGAPRTLRAWLQQEGRALRFAGVRPDLDRARLDATLLRLKPSLDSTSFGVAYAVLYGDEAAKVAGYSPFGFGPREGFTVAAALAWQEPGDPVALLR
jgi:hypothetical protein